MTFFRRFGSWRRSRLVARFPINTALWFDVVAALDVLRGLNDDDIERLRELAALFVHRKKFYGTFDFVIDDYIRVAVAAQACLPILNLVPAFETDIYPRWVSIVLYPGTYVARHRYRDQIGLLHDELSARDGETSKRGPIVLSWTDSRPGAFAPKEGRNVVVHEFAHKLDLLDGVANGHPPLHPGMSAQEWTSALADAFAHMQRQTERHRPAPFNPYAATNPAEFFAVMSEAFFQIPYRLRHVYPAVYRQFMFFYKQDPAARRSPVPKVHKRHMT